MLGRYYEEGTPLDDDFIVTAFVVLDQAMAALGHRDDVRAQASDAAVLTVAVVAARYCQHHLERAWGMLRLGRSLSGPRSVSRCNRRRHRLADWLALLLEALGALFARGAGFLLDSLPVPVCHRARARRCRTVRGRACCGQCAATGGRFFGWRRHLGCTPAGVPVACDRVPGGLPGTLWVLTPIPELPSGLRDGAAVYADKADNAADDEARIVAATGVRLVPLRKATRRPHAWADKLALRAYRKRGEAVYSQWEALGVQRLRARTNPGLDLKLHASLLALTIANAD